jgi:release factor glutamine methyltransferase
MNHLIADNKVSTLRSYLFDNLSTCYESREAGNVVFELFKAFNDWGRADVVLNAHQRLGESQLLKYHFALKRLLPRPETEELINWVVSSNTLSNPRILDVGTGSGCIAIGLKKRIPGAIVTAIDVSEGALNVAKMNASNLQADITFEKLNFLVSKPAMNFEIIVSNPPYIPAAEHNSIDTRVREHEPHLALFTPDSDSLVFYKRLMELSHEILADKGKVYCEIHENTTAALVELANNQLNQVPTFHRDLQGKNRMMSWSK